AAAGALSGAWGVVSAQIPSSRRGTRSASKTARERSGANRVEVALHRESSRDSQGSTADLAGKLCPRVRQFTVPRAPRPGAPGAGGGAPGAARPAAGRRVEARIFQLARHVPAVIAVGPLRRFDARIGELEQSRHGGAGRAEERLGHVVAVAIAVGKTEAEIE